VDGGRPTTTSSQLAVTYDAAHARTLAGVLPVPFAASDETQSGTLRATQAATSP
jgi:hypothetical protein